MVPSPSPVGPLPARRAGNFHFPGAHEKGARRCRRPPAISGICGIEMWPPSWKTHQTPETIFTPRRLTPALRQSFYDAKFGGGLAFRDGREFGVGDKNGRGLCRRGSPKRALLCHCRGSGMKYSNTAGIEKFKSCI